MADPVVHITNGVPDSGTGNITTLGQTLLDGANVTMGAKADTAVTATDTTPGSLVALLKGVISKLAGTLTVGTHAVTQSGTWTVQPGNTANTTPWLAKISDGTNAAAIKAASTAPVATDPAVVVAISPNSVNSNGRKTPANSAPVVEASRIYQAVAASASATALSGGGGGAVGDLLDGVLIVPGTSAAGAVSITDGAGSAMTIFAGGGTTALPTLAPFFVPIGAISGSGAWKVTTGTNVTCIAIGNFT